MSQTEAAPPLHEGVNDPSPITRVLALDWSDGPTEGVLELGEAGPVFKFALLDERQQGDESELRVYGLYSLPGGALDRLAEALTPYAAPRWPVWWPVWRFPTDAARESVETLANDVLGRAGPLAWVVVGDLGHGPIRALPVKAARAS